MIWPNENPLTIPNSLAAEGMMQGAGARADHRCEAKHSPQEASALILAQVATDAARVQLDRYALATDWPALDIVEAADLLDAARAALDGAP